MAYSVTTDKTWARILDDIEMSLAKWRNVTSWRADTTLAPRSSTKQNQTLQERTVTLHYVRRGKDYQIKMDRQRRAVDNLLVIWLILETLRLEVCEAAYRALSKMFHPDRGQSTAMQQSLNDAIAQIRKVKR